MVAYLWIRPLLSPQFCTIIKLCKNMEIITFDHQVYQDLANKIERIADYVFKKDSNSTQEPEMWLTSEELAELLKISTRTLQRMRKERVMPYSMIRSKCLYRLSDVEKCIAQRIVSCNPQTLEEFRRDYWLNNEQSSR